ncbi:MAG: heparinase II/III family protein [Blastocatellales bacterium]
MLRTIRYLRWEQLAYRPLRVAQYRFYKALPRLASRWTDANRKAPEVAGETIRTFRAVFEKSFAHLNTPLEEYDQRLADLTERRFTFLNRTLTLDSIDWNRRYESHLWNYQLHYFNFAVPCARALVERGDEKIWRICQSLIESWIEQTRVGRSDGWDAYPVSLRVVNWIYAYALVADVCDDRRFLERWRMSICQQLDFLSGHLELHLLANHLLKNVKALTLGGLFFNQRKWLAKGERLLWREFDEQVLEDGGHYERSPMYHAQATADFLECYALLQAFGHFSRKEEVEPKLRAMARFLDAMGYADGSLALFNDSANTEETRPRPIVESAARIIGRDEKPLPPAFPETGYYVWMSRDGAEKIIVDAGPVSVDYNTAHAHCDLLSYELWLDGKPFIVDSGVHGYGGDFYREYCRSTRAHNTVMFDGREQSEVWGTFRMARRAELTGVEVNSDEDAWSFSGAYQPFYDRRMTHERSIGRSADGDWIITDVAVGGSAARAQSFIHLHPRVSAKVVGGDSFAVECAAGSSVARIEPFGADAVEIIEAVKQPAQSWYFPDFGMAQAARTICFSYAVREGEAFGYRIIRQR